LTTSSGFKGVPAFLRGTQKQKLASEKGKKHFSKKKGKDEVQRRDRASGGSMNDEHTLDKKVIWEEKEKRTKFKKFPQGENSRQKGKSSPEWPKEGMNRRGKVWLQKKTRGHTSENASICVGTFRRGARRGKPSTPNEGERASEKDFTGIKRTKNKAGGRGKRM